MGKTLFNNKLDFTDMTGILPVNHGGTSTDDVDQAGNTLNMVTVNQRNAPMGVAGLDGHTKMMVPIFPTSVRNPTTIVDGPMQLEVNAVGLYTIVNYSNFNNYTISVSAGTIVRNNDILTFTAPTVQQTVTMTINDIMYSISIVPLSTYVSVPSVTSPANGSSDLGPNVTFNSSAFAVTNGNDAHEGSDWQLALDNGFTNIIGSVTNSGSNKTSWSMTGLSPDTTFYVRVRHKGAGLGYSNWSTSISFSTKLSYSPDSPSITSPVSGTSNLGPDVVFVGSAFSLTGGSDTHASSDWQVSTNSSFTAIVASITDSSANKTSWTAFGLTANTTFYARVRYKGAITGYSNWSNTSSFTTKVSYVPNTPSIISPINGATNLGPSITFTSLSFEYIGGSDTHEGSDWQVSTNSSFTAIVSSVTNSTTDKTSWSLNDIAANTTFYIRVRHKGTTTGYSNWSTTSSFSTKVNYLPTTELAKLVDSTGTANDGFGYSVAISSNNNYIIVGAYTADIFGSTNQGAARLYERSDTDWIERVKFTADDGVAYDTFGGSVDISANGDYVLIGAPALIENGSDHPGAAYVFAKEGMDWTQYKLVASDGAIGNQFGYSVALSNDGMYAIVGSPYSDISGKTDQGAAYVFIRSGSTWSQQAKLVASDGVAGEKFGQAVSINTAGNYVIIGATFGKVSDVAKGTAYVFVRSGASWTQQAKLVASDGAGYDYFGFSVDISSDGSYAIVGAYGVNAGTNDIGAAYIFTRSGTDWSQQAKLVASDGGNNYSFGLSVSMTSNGDSVLIANAHATIGINDGQGAAHIFTRSGSTWTQQAKLVASDGAWLDSFGTSVVLSSDSKYAVIGSPFDDMNSMNNKGSAYVFG